MKNLFEKNLTRRNFIKDIAKFIAAVTVFDLFPGDGEASHKKNDFKIPAISKFKPLNKIKIKETKLNFTGEMDVRTHTGAIIIHHSGLKEDRESSAAEIHEMHLKNGWSGIGYHFVVHKNGSIERGRPQHLVGAHSLSNNEFTIGICMTGNFSIGNVTKKQILSTEQLVAALCKEYGFAPKSTTIFGHRDLNDTSCPGDNFYPLLPEFIEIVQSVM